MWMMRRSIYQRTVAGLCCVGIMFGSGVPAAAAESSTETGAQMEMPMGRGSHGPGNGGMMAGGGMGGITEVDPEIQEILDSTSSKFQQFTYEDPDTGATMEYSLFIPDDYSEEESYPLIMFIPDATGADKSAQEVVQQYYGADIWATDQEQGKHASFVFVPTFSGTLVDDNWNVSDQVDTIYKALTAVIAQYSIDEDRVYTTGQSAGCMTSLYLNSQYPDMFAASLFVSGQWDISVLDCLQDEKFFYITAGGDEKASGGQDEVMNMLKEADISYSYGTWDAQEDADTQSASAENLISEGNNANFIRFEAGTVLNGQIGQEHMASFNYAYKIEAVRDWLFSQSRSVSAETEAADTGSSI